MWKNSEDNTIPVITAKGHINSCHKLKCKNLPKTAILFFMNSGIDYTIKHYDTELLSNHFPSFLNSRPIYKFTGNNVCFLHGGWGAAMAADTIETLKELGVQNIISVGMFGGFDHKISSGDIVIPDKALVEEGTSLHYYESIDFSTPDIDLHKKAVASISNAKVLPVISTDAVYRQTFYKENLWREKGAVGVDMETSALFSVGKFIELKVVSILIASDIHPLNENDKKWQWKMTKKMRYDFFDKCISFALNI